MKERVKVCVKEKKKKTETTWDRSSLSCGGEYINNKIKSSKTAQNSSNFSLNNTHKQRITRPRILQSYISSYLIIYILKRQSDDKNIFFFFLPVKKELKRT